MQKSSPYPSLQRNPVLLLVFASLLSVSVYLIAALYVYRMGFPLDDAWIHQTYARNLATFGEWSFVPHEPSGGSTAPLWSILLAPGFLLQISPLPWTYLLGIITLTGLAVFSEVLFRNIVGISRSWIPWMGLLIAFEWHLVWAAASGMETLLSALIITIVLGLLALKNRNFVLIGFLVGLSVWVRPDGITLLGPVALVILFDSLDKRPRLDSFIKLSIGFGVVVAFYFLFNLLTAGTPLPNTFYAKQAEYAILQQIPLYTRAIQLISLPLTGAGLLLFPGVIFIFIQAVKAKNWAILAGMIWVIGYYLLYAWRLPVTYQHGRYLIPAMPMLFIWGLAGLFQLSALLVQKRWMRILLRVWQLSTGFVIISFWILGAKAYATDVAVIESEMVNTAKWVATNIPEEDLVAAHDIGALGFFAPRKIIDLAGLISPDVIPFIRDEERLAEYLDYEQVDYLVTFPDWYLTLTINKEVIFSTGGQFAPQSGQDNMAVYSW